MKDRQKVILYSKLNDQNREFFYKLAAMSSLLTLNAKKEYNGNDTMVT